ncbi:MAG: type II toxin-antitoxin system HicB family antitoxin, partial [Thermomicrobia bacterium]|nr:type II toxin-antitoxin system HicB family antitoxin [Thermomicrobia bacterium]
MSVLTYKGYTADVEYDAQEGILYGHVLDLRDTITFQSENAAEIVDEFHLSVDEYLSFCAEQGTEPAKP